MSSAVWNRPRRDMCYLVGRRAQTLTPTQAAIAWNFLALRLEDLQDKDVPKFSNLITTIRAATIIGKRKP